jgi:ribosomal protein S18 acetylase RimI-like enzyme
MSLTSSFPEPVLPAEFRLCTYDQVNDIKVILEIINKGWSDLPGHKVADSNNVAWVNQQPQDSIFLLFDDKGKIAGTTSIVMLEDGLGRIDAGGIVPEYRTSDLYRSLALVALEYAVKHGCKKVMLESWGDYESTIEVYKKLGFEITIHELGYRFDIN